MKAISGKIYLGHARFLTGKKNVFITIIFAFLIVFSAFPQFGCQTNFAGNNPELYTQAINSVPFTCGSSLATDFAYAPEIKIIEKDAKQRILFSYTERCYYDLTLSFSSLMVCQKSKNGIVYFYPDSYFIKEKDINSRVAPPFTNEEIEYVKQINDWNAEIDLTKCTKKQSVKTKEIKYAKEVSNYNQLSSLLGNSYNIQGLYTGVFFTSDNNGLQLYVDCFNMDSQYYYFIAIAKNNQFTQATIIENPYDCINQIKQFKQENGWDDLCKATL